MSSPAPTAVQDVCEPQETPSRSPTCGLTGSCLLHVMPFHRSAKGKLATSTITDSPTAVQALPAVHEIARRDVSSDPVPGAVTIDHRLPFQRSISCEETSVPTAVHESADVHDTPSSSP
jgi:hypothetical protein